MKPELVSFKSIAEGNTLQAFVYDQSGNPIRTGTAQTSITQGGETTSGIFYISFKVYVSNIGNIELTDLVILNPSPAMLVSALQDALPTSEASILSIGETNVLAWNTANSCPGGESDCGGQEDCISTPQGDKCLIPIGALGGGQTIDFTLDLIADYQDATGNTQSIDTVNLVLPITFDQDEVIYRTNVFDDNFGSGAEIVIDVDEDGILEGYRYNTVGSNAYYTDNFRGWTVFGRLIFKETYGNDIIISYNNGLDKNVQQSVSGWKFIQGGSLPTTTTPTLPYSDLCGLSACRETYTILVSSPQQCGDGAITGGEICDIGIDEIPGTSDDVTSSTCILEGYTGGDLYCQAGCSDYDTSQCTTGDGGNIKFRTGYLNYRAGGADSAIAYSIACEGTNLLRYGYEAGSGIFTALCDERMPTASWCDGTCTKVLDNLPGEWRAGGSAPSLWRLDISSPDYTNEIMVCDDDGTQSVYYRYDSTNGNAVNVDASGTSIDDAYEVAC